MNRRETRLDRKINSILVSQRFYWNYRRHSWFGDW
jgi:hypothetical protein